MSQQILIVDDDPSNLQLLSFALRAGNYEISEAISLAEAYDLVDRIAFDLAIIDIELPDGNGLDIASELRAIQPSSFILITTATDNPLSLEKACRSGADIYIVKPFEIAQVLNFLRDPHHQHVDGELLVVHGRSRQTSYHC